jgi:hypothetical protein
MLSAKCNDVQDLRDFRLSDPLLNVVPQFLDLLTATRLSCALGVKFSRMVLACSHSAVYCLASDNTVLPANLRSVCMDFRNVYCTAELSVLYNLPPGLDSLELLHFKQSANLAMLPPRLTSVEFNGDFSTLAHGAFPASVRYVTFGASLMGEVTPAMFPRALKRLSFGSRVMSWGNEDRQVRSLTPGILPPTLESLAVGPAFDGPLTADMFPRSLRKLDLGVLFNRPIEANHIPPNVEFLFLPERFSSRIAFGALPLSLVMLCLGECFNHSLSCLEHLRNLKLLRLGREFQRSIVGLPRSLRSLHLEFYANYIFPGDLPDLTELFVLGHFYGMIEAGALPSSLRRLALGYCGKTTLPAGFFPKGLRWLDVSTNSDLRFSAPAGCKLTIFPDDDMWSLSSKATSLFAQSILNIF